MTADESEVGLKVVIGTAKDRLNRSSLDNSDASEFVVSKFAQLFHKSKI